MTTLRTYVRQFAQLRRASNAIFTEATKKRAQHKSVLLERPGRFARLDGKLMDRLLVGEIRHLPQKNDAEHGVEFFGLAAELLTVEGKQPLRRQLVKDVLPKQSFCTGIYASLVNDKR